MTHVTCKVTAKNWDQLQNPTLGNRVLATCTFLYNLTMLYRPSWDWAKLNALLDIIPLCLHVSPHLSHLTHPAVESRHGGISSAFVSSFCTLPRDYCTDTIIPEDWTVAKMWTTTRANELCTRLNASRATTNTIILYLVNAVRMATDTTSIAEAAVHRNRVSRQWNKHHSYPKGSDGTAL